MIFRTGICLAVALISTVPAWAQEQEPEPGQQNTVTLYGNIDQYLDYQHSSTGKSVLALQDGGYLKSRFGLRGNEDLGDGYSAKFTLESAISADTGTSGDKNGRFFDRQSWVSLATPYGEFRVGRQNTPFLVRGRDMDDTGRSLGSIINAFPVSTRLDNDLAYISPRVDGVLAEVHMALPETADGSNRQAVYQGFLEYADPQYRLGYGELRAAPPAGAPVQVPVVYQNAYADWVYGKGTVYIAAVRSNNSTSSVPSAFLLNPTGGAIGTGGVVAGTSADAQRYFNVYQISADYQLTPSLRVGALVGRIADTSHSGRDASGGSVEAYYSLSKRTTLYTVLDTLKNGPNGGFRMSGSGTPGTQIGSGGIGGPSDVQGQRLDGVHVGILFYF